MTGGPPGSTKYRVVARAFRGIQKTVSKPRVIRTAPVTELLTQGQEAGQEGFDPTVSANGRWVAFTSEAALLPTDTDGLNDIYLMDRRSGRLMHPLAVANSHVNNPSLSANGRYLAFQSTASNLATPAEGDFDYDVFVLDRKDGSLDLISAVNGDTAPGNGNSYVHAISDDGRFVAFASTADDLVSVPPPNTSARHAYVHDRSRSLSQGLDRKQSAWSSQSTFRMDVAGDGSRVVFSTTDGTLFPGQVDGSAIVAWEINEVGNIFNRSLLTPGLQASRPRLDRTGDLLAFTSTEDFDAADTNGEPDAYLRADAGDYLLAAPVGVEESTVEDISADGRYVATSTESPQPDDTNGTDDDIVVWDVRKQKHRLVTRGGAGPSSGASLSADGGVLAFGSAAAIVPDAPGDWDIFTMALR